MFGFNRRVNTSLTLALVATAVAAALLSVPASATCGGGGGGGEGGTGGEKTYTVPWKRVHVSDPAPKGKLLVYWFLNSDADFDASTLRSSRVLALWGAKCLSLAAVDANSPIAQKFCDGAGKTPKVVLADTDDTLIGKLDGDVKVEQVEQLFLAEVRKREQALMTKVDEARAKVTAGDKDGAVQQFKTVVEEKCLFPKPAREAVKELKKLGVSDVSALNIPDAPDLRATTTAKMDQLMTAGLKAENDADYSKAEALYREAHNLDSADPVPLRYLGELQRHHTGDWQQAAITLKQILAMDADPLSRAVALHGLGKMTIHGGEFKKGLGMIEESIRVYPLAMAYRNLAVYWNSEGDPKKAEEYTRMALKADPHDRYNLIFSAVFLAQAGHTDEALQIARANEDVLPASYNLAAIYALSGNKEKALAMLKRHFYQYERTQAVRSEEMMEARVDRVFDSLIKDPAFLALTADADGKLPLRRSGMQNH
jgi:tetratricopeptide (TPR) repeat protein